MKSLTRTIIVLVAFCLVMGSFALAQNAPGENVPEGSAEPTARARVPVPTPPETEPPSLELIGPTSPKPTPSEPPSVEPPVLPGPATGTPTSAATPPPPRGPVQIVTRTTQSTGLTRSASRKVLVIPTTEVKTEELVAITQDLQVMSHIFDERFKQPRLVRGRLVGKVFTDFGDFFGRDSRATEAIYLQGYGVLFLMEVNFAFSPPPKEQEKEAKKTEDVDPIWQRARQQIFSPKGFGGGSEFVSEERNNAEKIEVLKTELIRTLKHAANIRNLKPDEWVILTVIGQGWQPGGVYEDYYRSAAPRSGTSTSGRSRRPSSRSSSGGGGGFGGGYIASGRVSGGSGGGGYGGGMMGGMGMGGTYSGGYSEVYGGMGGFGGGMEYGEIGPPSATVLTIRAKKSDVDAFAKGELDFEQFQQKVDIFTY